MSLFRPLFVLLIGLMLLSAASANAGALISVDASLLSIPADGNSYTQILVTVLNETGTPAPDGTEVRLTTSAGDITQVIYTAGGRAVGILTSSTYPQIATVSAFANGASGSAQVEFSSSGYGETTERAGTLSIEGSSLAYCVDEDTVVASNGVTIECRGLTIRATGAQVRQATGQIRAQGEVVVRKDDQTLTADELSCDLRSGRILLHNLNDQSDSRSYQISTLKPTDAENPADNAQVFSPLMDVNGRTWIISRRLVLIPGDKILFFKASIYVADAKIMTVPYYSYSYKTRESLLQQIRYTSGDGMVVDLPFYYRVAASGVGALKLRYAADGGETGGYYRPRKGLSFGLEQGYSVGSRNQGRLFVDSLGSSAQAFELAHHLEFGSGMVGGRTDISARYQPTSIYARNIYNGAINTMGNLRNYNYTFSGYFGGSSIEQPDPLNPGTVKYVDQSSYSLRTMFRPKSPIIARGIGVLSPSLTVGYGDLWDLDGGPVSPTLYQSLGFTFNRSGSGSGRTSLSFGGATALTMTAQGDTGASLRLGPTLTNNWMGGSASLSYTLNLQSGVTDSVSALSTHQLGCNLFFTLGDEWSSFSSADYGLDSKRLNLSSTLNYRAFKHWQVRSSYNLYRYAYEMSGNSYTYDSSYLKVGIYRPIGPYEIGLAWSPDGQNYGMDSDKRVWLEIGGRGF